MKTPSIASLYRDCMLSNYAEPALSIVRGEGCHVWDDTGRRYLDFTSGIAVNSLGHSHPQWVKAVQEQAGILAHCSNLFRSEPILHVANRIQNHLGGGRMLFCNSGAEANEALIKLARLHGRQRANGEEGKCYKIIGAKNGFAGRTFGGMSLTPQPKIQNGFAPLVPGFAFADLHDPASFEALVDDDTAAIFIETIQGEGGVNVCPPAALRQIRELCTARGIMLILDEVQCGIGRSGTLFAFEQADVRPDAIGMAKGLGGGFPIGAIWVDEPFRDLFQPGSHGSTFAGNPLAGAAALAVLDVIEADNLLDHVRQASRHWHAELQQLATDFPNDIAEIRGLGFMVGVALHRDPAPIVAALRDRGLLTVPAGGQVIRLLPPLIAASELLSESVAHLRAVLSSQ